jgi:aspartate/methionine/tyrosine aminotransferase
MRRAMSRGLLALAGIALAMGAQAATSPENARKTCLNVSSMARSFMEARQRDVPMAEVMRATEDMPKGAIPLAREMVNDAFLQARQGTPEARKKAADDFEADYYGSCYDQLTQ